MARLGATVWTGDIQPSWEDLIKTPGMMLNQGLSGSPYVGCDIGGFTGNTNAELLTRWYQVGVFMPTMRVHSTLDATPHFPWLWGTEYEEPMRLALQLRYQLLPYHYSLAHKMFSQGQLWVRSLAAEFPDDFAALSITKQWLDGELLVAPVLQQQSKKDIYLPQGLWYHFNSSTATTVGPMHITGTASLEEIPAFVRPGSIVPLAPVIQHSGALPGGPLEIQVYSGANTSFELVEDDGETIAYESGAVKRTRFDWEEATQTLSWMVLSGIAPSKEPTTAFEQVFVKLFSAQGMKQSEVVTLATSGSIVMRERIVEVIV